MRFFLFLSQNALFDLWLKVRWSAWLHSLSEFHKKKKKNFFLFQWPWIKASFDKSWRTFAVQKALPNRSVVKQLPWCPLHPTKVIYFWYLSSVRHSGSGNHTDFLRKYYQTYIEFRSSLSYRTKLVGSHLNSRNKWIFIKAEFLKMVKNVVSLFSVLRWHPDLL